MNMHLIDWAIVVALVVVLTATAIYTLRFTKSVSAFLSANRCGGRYLIAVADGMAMTGVITLVWFFELNYEVGYTSMWWGMMEGPALIVMALSGWVIYRYRQTRAMTLAQFFELRYSRRFRVFAGIVACVAGIINFGIFPSVGARFFIALCGLPDSFTLVGIEISTFPACMVVLLSISLMFVFLGGQVAVMVTDFLQGVFGNIVFVIVILFLLLVFSWSQISETLLSAPQQNSLAQPFQLGEEEHFNFWYFAISIIVMFYGVLAWQGTQGYKSAAKDPHEAKMAGILGGWRFRVLMLIVIVVPICVRTFLQHPDFAEASAGVTASLDGIGNDALRNQLRTPLALGAMLPVGLLGLMCAAMLAALISTYDTYLHSWGSIVIQDVVLPFRKRPLSSRQHLWMLRMSILGVAIFIFLFSLYYEPQQYIAMFLALTGSIFLGGAGSAIIGGLYWKRGTTAGAWAAMITGIVLASLGTMIHQLELSYFYDRIDTHPWLKWPLFVKEELTGQELTFWAIACAVCVYVVVSLLGRRTFDLDRMLHRGAHALPGESSTSIREARTWLERLGIDRDFVGRDKLVTYITIAWPIIWTGIFIAGTIYNLIFDVPEDSWLAFWHGWTWFILACSVVVTIWFTIGGWMDLGDMFRRLRRYKDNPLDDGRVEDHHNLGEPDD
jgi:SSS family solute:Na+ symporter